MPFNPDLPLNVEEILALDDHRLDVFRSLKTTNAARDASLFVAEGSTVVERVLRSEFSVHSLLISDRKWNWLQETYLARRPAHTAGGHDFPIYRMSHTLAERLVGFAFHSGILVAVHRRPALPFDQIVPTLKSPDESPAPILLLAGDRIVDPENVGSLIRIASAFGAAAVILGPGSADPFSRRVLRVSMGNVLFLPVMETKDLALTLTELKSDYNFHICSTVLNSSAQHLSLHTFHPRTVLVFGNEYDGISPATLGVTDTALTIPMLNGTDSLNIAIAAGICAYQYQQFKGS